MKNRRFFFGRVAPFRPRLPFLLASAITTAAFVHSASGVTLVTADALGNSSFNTGTRWSDALAPGPGKTYQTSLLLRTPNVTGTPFIFGGDSLEVLAGGTLRDKTQNATITINNLILANSAAVEFTQPGTPIINNATAAGTLAGNITLNGTATIRAGLAITDVAGATFTVSSTIGGTGGFATTGANGKLVLTGSNNYSGGTTITGGTVQLANLNAAAGSTVTISAANGLTFTPAIGSFNIGGLAGASNETLNDTGGAAVTLITGGNGANTTYSGGLGGLGGLTKAGNGTLTLSGANTYAGATTVNTGKLNITGSLDPASAVSVNGGSALGGSGDEFSTGLVHGTVTLASGSTDPARGAINLTDGAFGTLTLTHAAGLALGGSAGNSARLVFETGLASADVLSLGANPLVVNEGGAAITIANVGLASNQTYTILKYGSGSGAGFVEGSGTTVGNLTLTNPNLSFGISGSLQVEATQVRLVTSGASAPATAYWSGIRGTQWTDTNGTFGNFTTDAAGTNFIQAYPNASSSVIFAAAGNGAPANLAGTILGQDFPINSLTFAGGTGAAGIGGSNLLTVGAGGITLDGGNGGATLSMTTLALADSQTWSNASTQNLAVSAAVTGTAALTISNTSTGATILSGANTYSGGTILSTGVLRMGGAGTLGANTGSLAVNGGTLELNGTNQVTGNFTGSGGQIVNNGAVNSTLTIGSGDAVGGEYPGVLADTNNAGAGTLGLTNAGTGLMTLSGLNTYTGPTTLSGGVLSIAVFGNSGVASGIGQAGSAAANLVFDGGTLQYTGPATATNRDFTIAAGKTAVINTASKITMTGATPVSTGGFTKLGAGELELSAVHAYSGRTSVNGGLLTLTGTLNSAAAEGTGSLVVAGAAGDAVLHFSGGTINLGAAGPTAGISGSIGHVAGAHGSLVMTGGAISVNSGLIKQNFNTGSAGYGALTMSGGSISLAGNFGVGTLAGGRGVQNISGGSITVANGYGGILGNVGTSMGVASYTGTSSFTATSTAVQAAPAFIGMAVGEAGFGILNVSGQASLTLGGAADAAGLDLGRNNVATAFGIANLGAVGSGGGTITTNAVRHSGAAGTGVFNFHGGTLRAATFANPAFMAGLTGAYVFGEGARIDTNGVSTAIAQPLLAPTGQGITAIALTDNGTGYVNSPIVTVTGGTLIANGTQATAVANFNPATGEVTGITITNPGSYFDASGLTVAFAGGGSLAVAPVTGTITTAANSSGGLTKTGLGTLTLSGLNTYTGATTVSDGTLSVTRAGLSNASSVSISTTGKLSLDFDESVGQVTDVVAALFLDGSLVSVSPGTYGANGSGATHIDDGHFAGVGTLTVGPSNYATWATANGIPGEPASGDFDKDGLTNLVEYALGKNPRVSSQPAGSSAGTTITFIKGTEAVASHDVNFVIESSTDLIGWSPAVTQNAPDLSPSISFTLPADQPKEFARLKVSQVAP